MSKNERLVTFTLLGQEYSFYTGSSEEEMAKVFNFVRSLVEKNSDESTAGTIPVGKRAILACLNIGSQYLRLENDFEEYKKHSDKKIRSLIEKIESCLESEKKETNV